MSKTTLRKAVVSILCAALASIAHAQAPAADFPTKPLRIVVPYPPGGATDALSRMIAQEMAKHAGQPVIVDNRAGASEQIAVAALRSAAPDGHTFMLSTMGGLTVNPSLYGEKLTYDPQKDLKPIALAAVLPNVLLVTPSLPVQTVDELIAYARANPGKLSYGSSGAGQSTHLAMEVFKRSAGIDILHVPYKGGAPALQDLMSGQVQVMIAVAAESMPYVRAGKLRALAVANAEATSLYPELPPMSTAKDLKGFHVPIWFAYMAPSSSPPAVIARLNRLINQVLGNQAFRKKMSEMGMEPAGGQSATLESLVVSETEKWKAVIDSAGIRLD